MKLYAWVDEELASKFAMVADAQGRSVSNLLRLQVKRTVEEAALAPITDITHETRQLLPTHSRVSGKR